MKRTKKQRKGPPFPDAMDDLDPMGIVSDPPREKFHVAFPPKGDNPWPKLNKDKPGKGYVLTNDPSITAWGWAIVDPSDNSIVDHGAIKTVPQAKKLRTRKGDDRVRRIQEINAELIRVIKKYSPSLLISELPHGSQSAVAATGIGIVTGVMQTIGDCLNIPVEWFSEGDAKMATLGRRSAEKDDMVIKICDLFKCKRWTGIAWRDEAVADSLAVYYVARQQSTALKMLAVVQ